MQCRKQTDAANNLTKLNAGGLIEEQTVCIPAFQPRLAKLNCDSKVAMQVGRYLLETPGFQELIGKWVLDSIECRYTLMIDPQWISDGFPGKDKIDDFNATFALLLEAADKFLAQNYPEEFDGFKRRQLIFQSIDMAVGFAQPALTEAELKKLPTQENYLGWFFQNYGIIMPESFDHPKLIQRFAKDIKKIQKTWGGFYGGFVLYVESLDFYGTNRWYGGAWDGATNVLTIKDPFSDDEDDDLESFDRNFFHEYAHRIDSTVLGQLVPAVETVVNDNGKIWNIPSLSIDGSYSMQNPEKVGFSKEKHPGYIQYESPYSTTEWWRDPKLTKFSHEPDRLKRFYGNKNPAELFAMMNEIYVAQNGTFQGYAYSEQEIAWFQEIVYAFKSLGV